MIINHTVCVLKVEQNNTDICLDHLFHAKQIVRAGLCCGVFSPDNACSIQNMCKKLPKYL